MSLFFINQATYLEVSRPISCLQLDVKKSGTFPAFQETNTLGKKVVKIGQKIEWGRDRHKTFLEFLGL